MEARRPFVATARPDGQAPCVLVVSANLAQVFTQDGTLLAEIDTVPVKPLMPAVDPEPTRVQPLPVVAPSARATAVLAVYEPYSGRLMGHETPEGARAHAHDVEGCVVALPIVDDFRPGMRLVPPAFAPGVARRDA